MEHINIILYLQIFQLFGASNFLVSYSTWNQI